MERQHADISVALATIGVITSAVATVYFVWMLYNDWQPTTSLTSWRQLSWSMLHFPFHLATVLFVGGSAQLIMWWKICEINRDSEFLVTIDDDQSVVDGGLPNMTKEHILGGLNKTADEIFERWRPHHPSTREHYDQFYASLSNLSDAAWYNISNAPGNITNDNLDQHPAILDFVNLIQNITATVENSLLATFHIDSIADADAAQDAATFETKVFSQNEERLYLVVSFTCDLFLPLRFIIDMIPPVHLHLCLRRRDSFPDDLPIHDRAYQALEPVQRCPRVHHPTHCRWTGAHKPHLLVQLKLRRRLRIFPLDSADVLPDLLLPVDHVQHPEVYFRAGDAETSAAAAPAGREGWAYGR